MKVVIIVRVTLKYEKPNKFLNTVLTIAILGVAVGGIYGIYRFIRILILGIALGREVIR